MGFALVSVREHLHGVHACDQLRVSLVFARVGRSPPVAGETACRVGLAEHVAHS